MSAGCRVRKLAVIARPLVSTVLAISFSPAPKMFTVHLYFFTALTRVVTADGRSIIVVDVSKRGVDVLDVIDAASCSHHHIFS